MNKVLLLIREKFVMIFSKIGWIQGIEHGEVAEWSKATDLKSVVRATVP